MSGELKKVGIGFKVALLLMALVCSPLYADTKYTIKIQPKKGDNFLQASFSLLVSRKVKKPRYLLVLVPGFNGDGSRFLQHRPWRDFAEATGGAMIACSFIALNEQTPEEIKNYVHYAAAQHGSGATLESAIEQFDVMDEAHSLKDLPLLVYGHSAGGQFAYGFSCHHPKRMIGFAAAKGGYYYPEPIEGTYKVPGLIISGEQDLARRRKEIRALFESHRKHGAPWCWMEDEYGHGTGKTLDVIFPYFRELLRNRLTENSNVPVPLSKKSGVIVDLESKAFHLQGEAESEQGINPRVGYLPSVDVFKAWSLQDTGKRKYLGHPSQPAR